MELREVTVKQARELTVRYAAAVDDVELIDIGGACKRILAEDVIAGFDNPPFNRSPLDGFAVRSVDIAGASEENPAELLVIDEVCAGDVAEAVPAEGQAVRIMTGAPIPAGADCVVKQEDTVCGADDGTYARRGETVRIYRSAGHHENFCFAGEDFHEGQTLLMKDRKLTCVEVGILASLGRTHVEVYRKPRLAVIATGDEIIMPGNPLTGGKIYNSNMFMIKAGAMECGAEVVYCKQAGDSPELIADCLREASGLADIVVTTGGVSVGKKDYIPQALKINGAQVVFNRISMKPGSPTTFAMLNGKPTLSLTGTPFGAAVNFNLLVKPVIAKVGRDKSLDVSYGTAVFRGTFTKESRKTRYVRGIFKGGEVVQPEGLNSNGVIGNMGGCNCYIEIPAGTKRLLDGEMVRVVDI